MISYFWAGRGHRSGRSRRVGPWLLRGPAVRLRTGGAPRRTPVSIAVTVLRSTWTCWQVLETLDDLSSQSVFYLTAMVLWAAHDLTARLRASRRASSVPEPSPFPQTVTASPPPSLPHS